MMPALLSHWEGVPIAYLHPHCTPIAARLASANCTRKSLKDCAEKGLCASCPWRDKPVDRAGTGNHTYQRFATTPPLELFMRVITVSLETMNIVNGLPKLDI